MTDQAQETQTWIDAIATLFEQSWRAGQRPRIEDCLLGVEEPRRSLLLEELLRVEREIRAGRGDSPTTEEYQGRFPDDAAVIAVAFTPRAPGASDTRRTPGGDRFAALAEPGEKEAGDWPHTRSDAKAPE